MDTSFEMNQALNKSQPRNFILFAFILLLLIAAGLYAFASRASQTGISTATVISQRALEEQYGLRVNLVAVTAAGGMVDLRLKIVDGEKAKSLLQDKKNFPALLINDTNVTLNVSEDAKAQEIKFENDGNIFLMFPNSGNAVKPGTPVTILFGDTAIEPVIAK